MKGKTPLRGENQTLLRILFLAAFFLCGVFFGQAAALRVPPAVGRELRNYLSDFLLLEEGSLRSEAVLSALLIYFRYPLLACLLGFMSLGLVLLPCAAAVFGFFFSFSVCCFTAVFGGEGVLLALAVFGLRCAVTLPCFFLLAVPAWSASASLAAFSVGKGKRVTVYDRRWLVRLGIVVLVLFAGVCVELFVSPYLLRLALERALF